MRNILIIILFATGLMLTSCSKSSPAPTCEEGGTEVDCRGIENGLAAVDSCGDCHQSYIYDSITHETTYTDDTTGLVLGANEIFILAGSVEDIAANPNWNAGCK